MSTAALALVLSAAMLHATRNVVARKTGGDARFARVRALLVVSAPVGHVAPAREGSMRFAALLGGRFLGEGEPGLRFVGAGVVALAPG